MDIPAPQGYLRRPDAARYLAVSIRYLAALQERRQIAFIKRGRMVAFRVADLDAWMQRFRTIPVWEKRAGKGATA